MNGIASERIKVKIDVPQGSILRTDFFLMYINTLSEKCPNTEFFLVGIFLYSD